MSEIDLSPGESIFNRVDLFLDYPSLRNEYGIENPIPMAEARIDSLVARAQNGEEEAFTQLYKEYAGPIFRYISLRVGRVDQSEDLTQEVFLRVLHNIRSYRFEGKPFVSWIFRIARNLVIDYYRQNKHYKSALFVEPIMNGSDDPMVAAEQSYDISLVKQSIEKLPPREREVVSLRFGAELTVSETAQITGTTEGNVKKLQHEAIAKLRMRLKACQPRSAVKINGLFLDYDGTISPLDVSRQHSRVPLHLETLLSRIQKLVPVSVITAKDLNFILPRTSFAHAWGAIAGLEIKTNSQFLVSEGVKKALPSLNQALTYAKENAWQGSVIEEKRDHTGQPLAFCVDWRLVKDLKEAKLMACRILDYCQKLQLKTIRYPGKPYFDVFSCPINKGKTLMRIKKTLNLSGNILYMGDSITDNAAFREADISIGVTSGRKPSGLDCQYWIKFEEVAYFLSHLFKNDFTFSPALPGIRVQD